jgi:hypothetical protein
MVNVAIGPASLNYSQVNITEQMMLALRPGRGFQSANVRPRPKDRPVPVVGLSSDEIKDTSKRGAQVFFNYPSSF